MTVKVRLRPGEYVLTHQSLKALARKRRMTVILDIPPGGCRSPATRAGQLAAEQRHQPR